MSGGAADGFPCDGSRGGTSSAGDGQRAGDPDVGGAPAVSRRRSSRSDGRIGEGILQVRANGSPGADALLAGSVVCTLQAPADQPAEMAASPSLQQHDATD